MIRRHIYALAADLAGPLVVAAASAQGRFGGRWRERLGLAPLGDGGRLRLWVHGASVGEVRSAAVLIHQLLNLEPEAQIFLSAGTPAGLQTASKLLAEEREGRVELMAAPLDFWGSPRRALARLRPQALVIMETELWPNLIFEAERAGVKLILAAARLSDRSFRRYLRVKNFMSQLLARFQLLAAATPEDFKAYRALGAPLKGLKLMGNPKFDGLLSQAQSAPARQKIEDWRLRLWGQGPAAPLISAGSTHESEEPVILEAYQQLVERRPDIKLILAPRHLNAAPRLMELLNKRSLRAALASRDQAPLLASAQVLVVDLLGELNALYALADLALVGGSLASGLNGHNPLEPAAVATPMIFGPHMSSFRHQALSLIEAGAALQSSASTLAADLERCLSKTSPIDGSRGLAHLSAQPAAAPPLARAIVDLARSK